MPEQFMRIGGSDGTAARALSTDSRGALHTKNFRSRSPFVVGDINQGAEKVTPILNTNGFTSGLLNISTTAGALEIYIQYFSIKRGTNTLEGLGFQKLYSKSETLREVSYNLPTSHYQLKIKNIAPHNIYLGDSIERLQNSVDVQKVRMTNIKDFQQIELDFPSIPAGQTISVVAVPEAVGIFWNVKFMTAIIDSGQTGSRIKLEWRLGAEDVVNRFMELYGYNGKIYLTPSGLTDGELRTPVEFSNNKIPQFWEHLQSVAYIDRNTPSRFSIENTSSATIENPKVRLYVIEERI